VEQVEKLGTWELSVTAEPAGEGYVPSTVRWRLSAERRRAGDGCPTIGDDARAMLGAIIPGEGFMGIVGGVADAPRAHRVQVAELYTTAEPDEAIGRLLDAAMPVVD
jgi:hypothetical protein